MNSVIYDFKNVPFVVKSRLLDTYLDLQGSQLWNYSKHYVNIFLSCVTLFNDFGEFLI